MNTEGVLSAVPDPENHTVTVRFDDTRTDPDRIMQALEEGRYPVEGDPEFLE